MHMAGGTDISFTGDELRRGGQLASTTADAAGTIADLIATISIDAAAFGQLPAAAALGTALSAFRDGHAELGRHVQTAHVELAGRVAGTAQGGEEMVRHTTAQAGAVPTGPGFAP
jgi:hypothetical protein